MNFLSADANSKCGRELALCRILVPKGKLHTTFQSLFRCVSRTSNRSVSLDEIHYGVADQVPDSENAPQTELFGELYL